MRSAPLLALAPALLLLATGGLSAAPSIAPAATAATTTVELGTAEPIVSDQLWRVYLRDAPLVRQLERQQATELVEGSLRKIDFRSARARLLSKRLDDVLEQRRGEIEALLGRPVESSMRLEVLRTGLLVPMTAEEAERVRRLPFVEEVAPEVFFPAQTDAGPTWIGAPGIWNGSATGGLEGTQGEGVVVGVLDHGLNWSHPSFSDTPDDGHDYSATNPWGPGVFGGLCDPGLPSPHPGCNDKVIALHDVIAGHVCDADGPSDDEGHGSHVASTAVGNALNTPPIAGVAPHSHLISYDVCFNTYPSNPNPQCQGGYGPTNRWCSQFAMEVAVGQAVIDGVDILNLSILGSKTPWATSNSIDLALLDALDFADILAVVSAGNDGPTAGSVTNLGPWLLTVGASTHERVGRTTTLRDLGGGDTSPPADLTVGSWTDAVFGPAPIVLADSTRPYDPTSRAANCADPFPPDTFPADAIVACELRWVGEIVSVEEKAENAAAGGAGAILVLGNANALTFPFPTPIPSANLTVADADLLRAWLLSGSGHVGEIGASSAVLDANAADRMASFSSRGPALQLDLVKPDLTAPGEGILAAYTDVVWGADYFYSSGTSMATPHAAGAAALLRALHPDWTAMEVKSALMTTADPSVTDGAFAADPHDTGSGRVDLSQAARAGFVLDETAAAFRAADPALGGDPASLNLPSMAKRDCAGDCAWRRTLRSTLGSTVSWSVTTSAPAGVELLVAEDTLTLPPGASAELIAAVRIVDPALVGPAWRFGEVRLSPDDGSIPDARLPVALVATDVSGTGVIEITKTVLGAAAPAPWSFTLSTATEGCSVADVLENPVSVPGGGGVARFLGVPVDGTSGPCQYTIVESEQAGWALDPLASDALTGIESSADKARSVSIVNVELPGTLRVAVDVTGNVEGYVPGTTFDYQLDCQGTSFDETFSLADDQTLPLPDLPAGTSCSLSQLDRPALLPDFVWRDPAIAPAAHVVVQRASTTDLTVTNPVVPREVFVDDFETGGMTAWSAVAPP